MTDYYETQSIVGEKKKWQEQSRILIFMKTKKTVFMKWHNITDPWNFMMKNWLYLSQNLLLCYFLVSVQYLIISFNKISLCINSFSAGVMKRISRGVNDYYHYWRHLYSLKFVPWGKRNFFEFKSEILIPLNNDWNSTTSLPSLYFNYWIIRVDFIIYLIPTQIVPRFIYAINKFIIYR